MTSEHTGGVVMSQAEGSGDLRGYETVRAQHMHMTFDGRLILFYQLTGTRSLWD